MLILTKMSLIPYVILYFIFSPSCHLMFQSSRLRVMNHEEVNLINSSVHSRLRLKKYSGFHRHCSPPPTWQPVCPGAKFSKDETIWQLCQHKRAVLKTGDMYSVSLDETCFVPFRHWKEETRYSCEFVLFLSS